ncbi:MAG TPA: 4Fe-4S ferredoxin [Richelia sp.]|nr:4Fe-4S ferredoxin [Richelia sp.]
MVNLYNHLQALEQGNWFKLICGASYKFLPAVRNLTLVYTLAGADCIDIAADPAVVASARRGLEVARNFTVLSQEQGFNENQIPPLLMVSLNDGEDPHFRKAKFDPDMCPSNCTGPCERICPSQAIILNTRQGLVYKENKIEEFSAGIIPEKCYGCGRCLSVCSHGLIHTSSYLSRLEMIIPLILSSGINAIEIHTQVGNLLEFRRLWNKITPWVEQLELVAISCPDGKGVIEYLKSLCTEVMPLPCALVWQTDGRPMSGDIGKGTTMAAVKFGKKVLTAQLPGYVQLAGGTNNYTVPKLKDMGLLYKENSQSYISGVGYGSYARMLLSPILEKLENKEMNITGMSAKNHLEEEPKLLWEAVCLASSLVSQIKSL